MSNFKIVLVAPDIPGNTGSIGRTCVALDLDLILIKPYGFDLNEKSVRRAGLDYWKHVSLFEYDSWEDFITGENPSVNDLFFLSTKVKPLYYDAPFKKDCYLVFGAETKGLPSKLFEQYLENFYTMPMFSDKVRSLNLSNAMTAVTYEAIRKISYEG